MILLDIMSTIADRIEKIEYWIRGNGEPGAALIVKRNRDDITDLKKIVGCHDVSINELEKKDISTESKIERLIEMAEEQKRYRQERIELERSSKMHWQNWFVAIAGVIIAATGIYITISQTDNVSKNELLQIVKEIKK